VLGYVFLSCATALAASAALHDVIGKPRHIVPRSSSHPRLPAYAVSKSNPIAAKATGPRLNTPTNTSVPFSPGGLLTA